MTAEEKIANDYVAMFPYSTNSQIWNKIRSSLSEAIEKYGKQQYNEAIRDAAESAKIRTTSCGDPMTCGCQGTCDHPVHYIDKQSILKLSKKE